MVMDVTSQKQLETKYAAIHDFSKKVTTLLEMDDILSTTIDLISRVLGHKYCAILLLDSEKRQLSQTAYRGYSKKQMDNLKLSLRGKGITTWVAREGKPAIVMDVAGDERYVRVFDDVKSEAAVPIKLGDEVIGVINVESAQANAFSEGDLTLLSALASYLAVSIKNSRLFKDLAHARDELEQWGLQLEGKVKARTEELQDAQEQLLRSDRLATIGQLAASVGHELRNPLGVLHNSLYLLESKLKDGDEKIKRQLETMKREVSRSNAIISDLLNFSRSGKPSLALTDLKETVEEALSKVSVPDGVEVVRDLAGVPQISADRIQLESVIINLVSNGIQAMPEGGTLRVETSENGDHVQLKVSDSGVGIPRESLDKIFEPLYTTKSKGIGLGLCVTKRFIENHGGTIDVESVQDRGTTFKVKLPLEREREEKLAVRSSR
jgi:signal transduction histidine kinase